MLGPGGIASKVESVLASSATAAGPRVRKSYDGHWMNSGMPFLAFMVVGCGGLSVLLQVGGPTTITLLYSVTAYRISPLSD